MSNRLDILKTQELAVCHDCKRVHLCAPNSKEAIEFFRRHLRHNCELIEAKRKLFKLNDSLGDDLFEKLGGVVYDIPQLGYSTYQGNANVKEAFGTATAFTKTNANLAVSATAGWMGNAIDNSSNLYLDALVGIELAAVNTAPAGIQSLLMYAAGLIEGSSAYTSTGDGTPSGSEGTLTFPNVTTLPVVCPQIGVVSYPVQNKAINGGPWSVANAFQYLPVKWLPLMINQMGPTLSVTNIYYIEVYNTVS